MLILLFPELPRWLIDHGRPVAGLQTVAKLHTHGNSEDPVGAVEFDQIQEAITLEHEHEAKSFTELFADRSWLCRLFLACAIQALCK